GLSDHTMKSYCTYIRTYLEYLDLIGKYPSQSTWKDMRNYLIWLQDSRHIADRTINVAIAQLRFFTMYVMHKPWDRTQVPKRKFDVYLPFVPTQDEAETFISTLPDLKQQAMVSLMYSSGLRIGEVCNLRYEDVSRKLMRIHITHGKNRSDRYAVLSPRALDILTKYWYEFGRPEGWLFPKQTDNSRPIDTFYLSRHIHNHEEHLGWPHRLTCHSFRHAYGTHLYENGADLFTIKELLGHKSLSSTLIYIHLAAPDLRRVTSPFDAYGDKS
ncbi:MAG: tyrosine-type recombinase/integrase, partial [Lachnospiraceae bacterium]|nr:tyrosine-type recombinase/integrase [Lachnospiraceae bacterium]